MPTPKYTNADLKRFERKPLGIQIENDDEAPVDAGRLPQDDGMLDYEAIMARAHGSLDRANKLGAENSTSSLMSIENRLGELNRNRAPGLAHFARNFTEPARNVGDAIGLASLPVGLANAPAGGAMFGVGRALAAPDVLRRLVAPDDDESRLAAAGEGALLAAPEILHGTKKVFGAVAAPIRAARGARAAAESSVFANAAEREAVDGYAASKLAKGSEADAPSILREAHEATGRIHGEQTLRTQQPVEQTPDALSRVLDAGKSSRAAQATRLNHEQAWNVDVDRAVQIAMDVADETGQPIEKVMEGYLQSMPAAQKDILLGRLRQASQPIVAAEAEGRAMATAHPFDGDPIENALDRQAGRRKTDFTRRLLGIDKIPENGAPPTPKAKPKQQPFGGAAERARRARQMQHGQHQAAF